MEGSKEMIDLFSDFLCGRLRCMGDVCSELIERRLAVEKREHDGRRLIQMVQGAVSVVEDDCFAIELDDRAGRIRSRRRYRREGGGCFQVLSYTGFWR